MADVASWPPRGQSWIDEQVRLARSRGAFADSTKLRTINLKLATTVTTWAAEINVNTGNLSDDANPAASGSVMLHTSGATASSTSRWLDTGIIPLNLSATAKWALVVRGQLTTTPDAQTTMAYGVHEETGGTRQAMFGVRGSASTTAWDVGTDAANAQGGTIDTNRHDFMMVCDGSLLKLYVDDVLVASCSSAGIATDGYRVDNLIGNGTTAAAQSFKFTDYQFIVPVD